MLTYVLEQLPWGSVFYRRTKDEKDGQDVDKRFCVNDGTQFTSFAGTKVQILTPEELDKRYCVYDGTQFTCFTSTKVQILTPEELRAATARSVSMCAFVPAAASVCVLLYQQLRQDVYFCTRANLLLRPLPLSSKPFRSSGVGVRSQQTGENKEI